MDLNMLINECTDPGLAPPVFAPVSWHMDWLGRPFDTLEVWMVDDTGRRLRLRLGGAIVRPSTEGPGARPVAAHVPFDFAEELAAYLGCDLLLGDVNDAGAEG